MTTLVFWHGWGISTEAFSPLIAELKKDLPDTIRLQPMRLPGYDGSVLPEGDPATVWIGKMMEDIPGPVILCGWSMGAILAMSAAYHYPERIEKLILFGATPCFVQKPDWEHSISRETGRKFRTDVENDMHATLRHFVSLFNRKDTNARTIIRELLALPPSPLPVLEAGLDFLAETDLRPIVPEIRQETLLIHGAFDPLMPVEAAEWMQQTMPDATLEVLPGVAHAAFLSQPQECARLIRQFLLE